MKKRWHRHGYFFMLDALVAVGVLALGLFLLFGFYLRAPPTSETTTLSADILDYLASNKIEDVNNPYVGLDGTLWNLGLINDSQNTLLQQIGEFYAIRNYTLIERVIYNVTQNQLPTQFKFEISINGTNVFPLDRTVSHNVSKNRSQLLLFDRRIIYGNVKSNGDIIGPYKAEVAVWQDIS